MRPVVGADMVATGGLKIMLVSAAVKLLGACIPTMGFIDALVAARALMRLATRGLAMRRAMRSLAMWSLTAMLGLGR